MLTLVMPSLGTTWQQQQQVQQQMQQVQVRTAGAHDMSLRMGEQNVPHADAGDAVAGHNLAAATNAAADAAASATGEVRNSTSA
jgi:hypothetical protein